MQTCDHITILQDDKEPATRLLDVNANSLSHLISYIMGYLRYSICTIIVCSV